jgi:hypothetical protein
MKEAVRQIIDFLEKNDKVVEAALIESMLRELNLLRQSYTPYKTKVQK